MKTQFTAYISALTSLLLLSGCAVSDSGAFSDSEVSVSAQEELSAAAPNASALTPSVETTPVQTTTAQTDDVETAVSDAGESEESLSETEIRTISTENFTFVDFDYISDIAGITDPTECEWAAEPALDIMRNAEPETELVFTAAYVDDYDGDGRQEAFATVKCVFPEPQNGASETSYLIYVSADGQAELANEYPYEYITSIDLLDYGNDRQLVINAYGGLGATTHSSLLGAAGGHSTVFYDYRGDFTKSGFMLTLWGWQASGGMIIYDTEAHKYLSLVGKLIDPEEFFALDTNGIVDMEIGHYNHNEVRLLGNKYYLFGRYDYFGVLKFTYENGALVPYEDTDIRNFMFESEFEEVYLEDFDAAVATMKQP